MTLSRATKKTGESGFSLISVIIAVGLSAVVSLSLGSFFLNMIRSQKTITLEGEIIQLMDDVKRSLIRSTACIDSIATASSAKGSVSSLPIKLKSILDENGQTVATLGKIPGSNLNIQSININLSKSAPTLLADTLQTAELSIIFDDGATY